MKTNVTKLTELGCIEVIRQRLGVDEQDTSFDHVINNMTPDQVVRHWTAWYLGDSTWWDKMKEVYDELKN